MAVTIYGDVLVIVNLYVDFFLLWCTQRTLQLRCKTWRMVLGALAGALCALECLLPQPQWVSLLWGVLSAILTTAVTFYPLSLRGFVKTALCFWAFSLVLAGFFLFLIRWAAPRNVAVVGHAVYFGLSPLLLFLFTGGAYLVFWLFQRLFHREDLTQKICRFAIEQDGKTVTLWAKADTGCALREPFSGLPVIVCQAASLKDLLPPETAQALQSKDPLSLEGIRLVPFESVGGTGVLPAFKPESVRCLPEGTALNCYIALWEREFPSGEFQALYGPDQFPELSPL